MDKVPQLEECTKNNGVNSTIFPVADGAFVIYR